MVPGTAAAPAWSIRRRRIPSLPTKVTSVPSREMSNLWRLSSLTPVTANRSLAMLSRRTGGAPAGSRERSAHDATAPSAVAKTKASPVTRRRRRSCGVGSAATAVPGSLGASSSSIRASPTSRSRRRGSFSRQRRSRRRTPAGTLAGRAAQPGSSLTIAESTSVSESPRKARVPVRHS